MPTTSEQQLILELINRARANPEGEFDALIQNGQGVTDLIDQAIDSFGVDLSVLAQQLSQYDPAAPLAFNSALESSAATHNDLMIEFDQQSHNLPGESGLGGRISEGGYDNFAAVSESVFAYAFDELYAHAGFYIDWGLGPNGIQDPAGHREAMLSGNFTEVGIAWEAEDSSSTTVGPFVTTHHYGTRFDYEAQLLGVVFDDGDSDNFYDVGEGMGGITITVTGNGETYTTTSWASGGYQLVVPDGIYTVTFSGGGLDQSFTAELVMDGDNVKLDLNADDPEGGGLTAAEETGLTLTGDEGEDTLVGGALDDVLIGNGQSDDLFGANGNDELLGGAGRDNLFGGRGNDDLSGGGGNDNLRGGGGRDELRGGGGRDDLYGGGGNDLLLGGNQRDMLFGQNGNDVIKGGKGSDLMVGGGGRDMMYGGGQGDTMSGNAAADELYGGGGNDRLLGGSGADTLDGGKGADRLLGGAGDDTMTGGLGTDTFIFSPNSGNDIITDFDIEVDQIKLTTALAGTLTIEGLIADAVVTSDGSTIIDFGNGNDLELLNVTDVDALADAFLI